MNARGSTSKTSGTAHGKRKAPGGNKSTSQNKATGRKGNTSTFSGTHDVEITEENMAFFKAIQAKLKAEKKATSESQDEGKLNWIIISFWFIKSLQQFVNGTKALCRKNLMEMNEINEEEDSRPSKKTRTESIVLDEEEAEIAFGLREK